MGRSRLRLLGLFGALLMLSPELLIMANAVDLYDVPADDPGVKAALAFAVERYNQERKNSYYYFKLLSIQDIKAQMSRPIEYRLSVELVKTACRKKPGVGKKYQMIQKCKQLPENLEQPDCYFGVIAGSEQFKMNEAITFCI